MLFCQDFFTEIELLCDTLKQHYLFHLNVTSYAKVQENRFRLGRSLPDLSVDICGLGLQTSGLGFNGPGLGLVPAGPVNITAKQPL